MKKILCVFCCFVIFMSLCSCGGQIPENPAEYTAEEISVTNPQNLAKEDNVKRVKDVKFVYPDYFEYKGNYAEPSSPYFLDNSFGTNAEGYIDLKILNIDSKKSDFYIGFKAFDSDGKEIRNSFIFADLKGIKNGDTIEGLRFDFPYEAVTVEFINYEF